MDREAADALEAQKRKQLEDSLREIARVSNLSKESCQVCEDAADALEAQAQQEADVARLDWLDRVGRESGCAFDHEGYGEYRYYVHRWYQGTEYPLARAVIDAAMLAYAGGKP
jgi:hypothetical protein